MGIELVLKNTRLILSQIHVQGSEAGMLDAAIKNIEACIGAIEKKKKEAAEHADDHDQQK